MNRDSRYRRMANENPSWGEERIANELLLKLGIKVSPRTVSKYVPKRPTGRPRGDMRWSTFLRLHAKGIIACDFFLAVTATFRQLYVFVVIEQRSRRLIHCNDRDCIFAQRLDESIKRLGVQVLKSPARSPTANAICERVIGSIRRECLDWLIPLSESHLRSTLKSWIAHYNHARPHMALGPGVPDPPTARHRIFSSGSRHRLREGFTVMSANAVLGGLHHEYLLAPTVAPLSFCG